MFALNPNSHQASRAAWVALHHSNYHGASPNGLRTLRHVIKASAKIIAHVGMKYYLHFATDDYISGQEAGDCFATVLYRKKSKPEVFIKCAHTQDQKQIQEEDGKFFQYLQHQTKPIIASKIPDSHGNIEHALLPVWALAVAGSSNIMLEKSKENVGYFLAQIKTVKQWIRKDNALEFEYIILLHKTPTQFETDNFHCTSLNAEEAQPLQYDLHLVNISHDPVPGTQLVLNWNFLLCLLEICKNAATLSRSGKESKMQSAPGNNHMKTDSVFLTSLSHPCSSSPVPLRKIYPADSQAKQQQQHALLTPGL
ncbi:UNVERIFIED_CONTAM: hypothetical protein H355_004782 [Colinus virginianus]|nr:hypothetical protein H355_004782 [Colinus virginianus]